MVNPGLLDKLEEKVVFRMSRYFFVGLCFISALVFLTGVFYFGWSLTPSTRGEDVKPLSITAADVKQHIATTKSVQPSTSGAEAIPGADLEEAKFNSNVDTLRILLPSTIYSWEGKSGFSGSEFVTDVGIGQRLNDFTRSFSDTHESNVALAQLCSVLREFPEDGRLKPLESFIALYTEKMPLHKEMVDKAESEYQENMMQKTSGKYESLVVIASAISTMAFLAIFLVLLSVQRNIKSLASK